MHQGRTTEITFLPKFAHQAAMARVKTARKEEKRKTRKRDRNNRKVNR